MKSAMILLAEGFEEVEAMTPVDLLRRAGVLVSVVSVTKSLIVTGSHKISIMADKLLEDTEEQQYDMVILPGGMPGTLNLQENESVQKIILEFIKKDKWVASICAAPKILGALGVLEGKDAICYPEYEHDLIGANVIREKVVRDGKIITSRGLGTAIPFALALVEALKDRETAQNIASSVIFTD